MEVVRLIAKYIWYWHCAGTHDYHVIYTQSYVLWVIERRYANFPSVPRKPASCNLPFGKKEFLESHEVVYFCYHITAKETIFMACLVKISRINETDNYPELNLTTNCNTFYINSSAECKLFDCSAGHNFGCWLWPSEPSDYNVNLPIVVLYKHRREKPRYSCEYFYIVWL